MIAFIRRTVVLGLLVAWSLPGAAFAGTNDESTGAAGSARTAAAESSERAPAATTGAPSSAAQQYAEREQGAKNLESFQGGGLSIYIGGGAVTAILIVLLILILV
jgi:hypothetical protein